MSRTPQYTISDLAKEFDITTRTIRFYEEKGLLKPSRRGQTRLYSNADRVKLILILRGKRIGLSLDESRDIIDMYNPKKDNSKQLQRLLDTVRERRHHLLEQLKDIQVMLEELEIAEQRCISGLEENIAKQKNGTRDKP